MTATDSRLHKGTLTLGTAPGKAFECQATNIRITPTHDEDGDSVEVLCGDVLPPVKKRSDVLAITAVQDFTDPAGFVAYTWTNDLVVVPFTWKPNETGPSYAGEVEVLACEIGGDVGVRITTEAEWTIVGPVTPTYPTPPAAAEEPATDDVPATA